MNRKLEKFISNNRHAFDDATPSDKVWQNLSKDLYQKREKRFILTPLYKWSIAAVLMVTAGTALFFFLNNNKPVTDIVNTVKNDSTYDINTQSPEYAPQVNEFIKLVAIKQDELKALAPEQPELYRQFTADIIQLDSSYRSLKNKLSITPNREMLIEAMIQNLQLQLNVLNQQLNIINQIKNSKKYSHEKEFKSI